MLFNSYIFIFLFLPITFIGFYLIGSRGYKRTALSWLVGASLFFYSWWNPAYLPLIIGSILVNYSIGFLLEKNDVKTKKFLLFLGVVLNLAFIAYFKYANFFVDNINNLFNSSFNLEKIILPLAISFFTFQQIAFLVDSYKAKTKDYNFLHYCLFVTFFPQLIAGPIVHHKEIIPQFLKDKLYQFNFNNLSIGLTIFILGLFKKVVLADGISTYVSPVFEAAEQDLTLSFFEAWCGALAYTLQLYFDFSGYSDMAIGLARMFGILLPLNFHSPYKSKNIIEFWRRWHMTLSRFLKDYVYIPLGGNKNGKVRRNINIMLTMLIGGLWHGAAWTFIAWGALHGAFLLINHLWHKISNILGFNNKQATWYGTFLSSTLTFLAIVVSWVLFRAESFSGATSMLKSMLNITSIKIQPIPESFSFIDQYHFILDQLFNNYLVGWSKGVFVISLLLMIVWFAPNTQEIMSNYKPAIGVPKRNEGMWWGWKPNIAFAIALSIISYWIFSSLTKPSEFLYFNF